MRSKWTNNFFGACLISFTGRLLPIKRKTYVAKKLKISLYRIGVRSTDWLVDRETARFFLVVGC